MEIRISDNIRRFRKDKNYTQEALANMLSITPQSVSKWERGEGYPDITMLPSIASFFGVTVDDLLGVDKAKREQNMQVLSQSLTITIQQYVRECLKFSLRQKQTE
jgi:transcriptional regulator with XRE-family HTH domain